MNPEFPMVDVLSAAALPELRAADYFARVFVEMGVPTWPNGFDLDPINLYIEFRNAGAPRQAAPAG